MTTSDARKRNAEQGPVLHDLDDVAEELGVDLSEPVDVTEEPHKVHDHGIDPTCRERVGSDGLLRGECVDPAPAGERRVNVTITDAHAEPADITEEPPVGSQVTDTQEDVWSRTADGWGCWEGGVRIQTITGDAWGNVRNHAPLRPTTDADRERVGLPVDPAPADVDPDEDDEPDPLAEVIHLAVSEELGWEHVAYAAREHIEAEREDDTTRGKILRLRREATEKVVATSRENAARIGKAEADLARVTEERDEWQARHAALRAAGRALTAEWHDRFMALPDATKRHADVLSDCTSQLDDILARDDERAES